MTAIVRDDEIRDGSPRIAGTRITVLDVKRRVIDNDEDPHVVAGEYDVSMADVFNALAHYYEHREEFEDRERAFDAARRSGEGRLRSRLNEGADGADEGGERAD